VHRSLPKICPLVLLHFCLTFITFSRHMKKLAVVILLTTLCVSTQAQKRTIDSLKKLIATAKDDTSRVMLMRSLGLVYLTSQPDSSALLAQQALQLSRANHFQRGEINSLSLLGGAFIQTGNYPKALTYYLAAYKLSESSGDQRASVRILGNIGTIYSNEGDLKKSITYTLKALAAAKLLRDDVSVQVDLSNLGDTYEKLNMLDSALMYTRQANEKAVKLKDADAIGIVLNNLGNIYAKLRKTDSALYYYRHAIPLLRQVGDDDTQCETTLGIARIMRLLSMPDSSLYYARQSIATGWRSGFTIRVLKASQFLTDYFKQRGQVDSAFRYLEVSVAAKDSLFSQEKTKELQNINLAEHQRQQEIQEKEVAYKTSVRYYLLLALIVFLVLMAIVFWRNSNQRQKANFVLQSQNAEIEKQKKSVETALAELKTTQNQLVQSAKMASLGELTAGIAHEIQNPLNFVNNFSEVNEEMLAELKEALTIGNTEEALTIANDLQENEKKIRHHGKRADFIVKGMLEHSRTSTGERQITNINVLVDEFLKLSYHGLRAKDKNFNADLMTNFDTSLPGINIVQQDIGRVLINLFSNAFYAVNQRTKTAGLDFKPSVEVSTALYNGSILISVKDNGNGIPENIREKIMQPFFTTKPTGEGTGLGLSLTYDIVVKGHGGKINVESKEDEGSEFTITLPADKR